MQESEQMITAEHGADIGSGVIRAKRHDGVPMTLEYRYHRAADGAFYGSISAWSPDEDDASLTAYMSRRLPDRAAVIAWVMGKAEKLTLPSED